MPNEKSITIRLPSNELKTLKNYCEQTGRSQTEILREFIRSLNSQVNQ